MKKFLNINATVTIILTQKGINCLNTNQKTYFKIRPSDTRKVITTELWYIMATLGPHLHMGQTELFQQNQILIDEDELV